MYLQCAWASVTKSRAVASLARSAAPSLQASRRPRRSARRSSVDLQMRRQQGAGAQHRPTDLRGDELVEVLEQRRAALTDTRGVLVVGHREALLGREAGPSGAE